MDIVNPSKQLTSDILSLIGDKHLNTGNPKIDSIFEKSPYLIEDFRAKGGHREFWAQLSNLLSENEIKSLNKTTELLFESGSLFCEANPLVGNRRYYQMVPVEDWVVKVELRFRSYRGSGFELSLFIKVSQRLYNNPSIDTNLYNSSNYVCDLFSSRYYDLITMAGKAKEAIVSRLSNNLADKIRHDVLKITSSEDEDVVRRFLERGEGLRDSYTWMRYSCPYTRFSQCSSLN